MKRIVVDMDDVMADATGQLLTYYHKEFGIELSREHLNHKDELQAFPEAHQKLVYEFTFRTDFFRTMIVKEDCVRVMERLNKEFEVFIVSSAMEFPNSLSEKFAWLQEHFPFLHWKQFVFCGRKSIVHGDFMIDDLPHNLEGFNGEKLLFSAPHNLHINSFHRMYSWLDVEKYFFPSQSSERN